MNALNNVLMVLVLMGIIIFIGRMICKIPLTPQYEETKKVRMKGATFEFWDKEKERNTMEITKIVSLIQKLSDLGIRKVETEEVSK